MAENKVLKFKVELVRDVHNTPLAERQFGAKHNMELVDIRLILGVRDWNCILDMTGVSILERIRLINLLGIVTNLRFIALWDMESKTTEERAQWKMYHAGEPYIPTSSKRARILRIPLACYLGMQVGEDHCIERGDVNDIQGSLGGSDNEGEGLLGLSLKIPSNAMLSNIPDDTFQAEVAQRAAMKKNLNKKQQEEETGVLMSSSDDDLLPMDGEDSA
jgi:hypothetical protein